GVGGRETSGRGGAPADAGPKERSGGSLLARRRCGRRWTVHGYARERSTAFDSSALEPDRRSPAGAVTPRRARSASMRPKASLCLSVAAIGAALLQTVLPARLAAQQTGPAGVTGGESELGRGGRGPARPTRRGS